MGGAMSHCNYQDSPLGLNGIPITLFTNIIPH